MSEMLALRRTSIVAGTVIALALTFSPAMARDGHGGEGHGGGGGEAHIGDSDRFGGSSGFLDRDQTSSLSRLNAGDRYSRDRFARSYHDRRYFGGEDDDCYPEWTHNYAEYPYRQAICPDW